MATIDVEPIMEGIRRLQQVQAQLRAGQLCRKKVTGDRSNRSKTRIHLPSAYWSGL